MKAFLSLKEEILHMLNMSSVDFVVVNMRGIRSCINRCRRPSCNRNGNYAATCSDVLPQKRQIFIVTSESRLSIGRGHASLSTYY